MPQPQPPLVDGFHSQAHKDAFLQTQAIAAADQAGGFTDAQMLGWLRELRKHVHIGVDADGNPMLYATKGLHELTQYWGTTHAQRQAAKSIGTTRQWAVLYVENETAPTDLSPYHDRVCVHALALGTEMASNPDQSALEPHLRNRTVGMFVQARNNMNGSYPIWLDGQYSWPPWNGGQGTWNAILDDDSGVHRGTLSKPVNNPWGLSTIW